MKREDFPKKKKNLWRRQESFASRVLLLWKRFHTDMNSGREDRAGLCGANAGWVYDRGGAAAAMEVGLRGFIMTQVYRTVARFEAGPKWGDKENGSEQ